MNDEPESEDERRSRTDMSEMDTSDDRQGDNGYLGWFLLEIVPIPIGLLIGSMNIFDPSRASKGHFAFFLSFTLLCTVTGGIGQCGGFKTRHWKHIISGVLLGIPIAVFDLCVIFFAGCCLAIGQIH
jgi:hypothetical protein